MPKKSKHQTWVEEQRKIWLDKQKKAEEHLWASSHDDVKENGGIVFNKSVTQQIEENRDATYRESGIEQGQLMNFIEDIMAHKPKQQLGRAIAIPSEADAYFNEPGYKVAYHVRTVNVSIGIGKDHCADLIMSEDAWEELKAGAEININTVEKRE